MNCTITIFNTLNTIVSQLFRTLKCNEREHSKGRKPALTNSEIVACSIFKQRQNIGSKKALYEILEPPLSYQKFVDALNRVGVYLAKIITAILRSFGKSAHFVKFTDATDIPVCLNKVWPRPIPAASRPLGRPRRGIGRADGVGIGICRRGNGANFVVAESAPPTQLAVADSSPPQGGRGILRSYNKNGTHHRTMRALSSWSKTGKGSFYGLKLHLSADVEGRALALRFTSGNSDDRTVFKKMNEKLRGLFVADAGYVSQKLKRDFFIENERILLTCTRKNMKKVSTPWQIALFNLRMRIEIHFRVLKVCYGLVTSLPRSIDGYLTHYLAAIAAHLLS